MEFRTPQISELGVNVNEKGGPDRHDMAEFQRQYSERRKQQASSVDGQSEVLTDLSYQIPHFQSLAASYHSKALRNLEKINNWANFIRAHALYNSCIIRCKNPQDQAAYKTKTRQLEVDYMTSAGLSHDQITQFLALKPPVSQLRELRNDLRKQLMNTSQLEQAYDIDQLDSEANAKIERAMVEKVKAISTRSTCGMINILRDLVIKVQQVLGEPPCSYDVAGCGSLAREEMTPYSDVEFFILHGDGDGSRIDKGYFITLSVLIYFIISNVGETNLHYMWIEELVKFKFKDEGPSGLKIDGLAPHAGNIPTGNGMAGSRILIDTPQGLIQTYQTEMQAGAQADTGINGNLSDLLSTTTLIYSYDSQGQNNSHLHSQFMDMKVTVDRSLLTTNSEQLASKIAVFKKDIEKHNFIPVPNSEYHGQQVHAAKQSIYRYPTILLNDLKIILQMHTANTPWDMVDALERDGMFSEGAAHNFRFLVAIALMTRLTVYLAHNSQKETLSFLKHSFDQSADSDKQDSEYQGLELDRVYMPQKWFISMAVVTIPLKLALRSRVADMEQPSDIRKCLRELDLTCKQDDTILSLAFTYQGDFDKCRLTLTRVFEQCDCSVAKFIEKLRAKLDEDNARRLLQIYPTVLSRYNDYKKAIYYLTSLIPLTKEPRTKIVTLNNLAVTQYLNGDYTSSLESQNKAMELLTTTAETILQLTTPVEEMQAGMLNNMGRILMILGRYDDALLKYSECKEWYDRLTNPTEEHRIDLATLLFNIANLNIERNNMGQAVAMHYKAMQMRLSIFGQTAIHSHIATSYDCLGRALLLQDATENKASAWNYIQQGFNMRKMLYTSNVTSSKSRTAMAYSYDHIAEYWLKMMEPRKAIESLVQSIEMRRQVFGVDGRHIDKAWSLSMLGDAYLMDSDTKTAEEYYIKAVDTLPRAERDEKKCKHITEKLEAVRALLQQDQPSRRE